MITMEVTGDHRCDEDTNQAAYYEIIDKFIAEINSRFGDSQDVLMAVAACSPIATNFLNFEALKPLIKQYHLNSSKLENEVSVAITAITNVKESDGANLRCIADVIQFLQPSWRAKPASWAVLRLFWITCVYIYI